MNKGALILFTRIPVPRKVKTRLMPFLSGAECAALQKAMTLDTAYTLAALNRDLFVYYSDEGADVLLGGLPDEARLCPQFGAELGERMYNALEDVLALGYQNCLLLGSDLPFLTGEGFLESYNKTSAIAATIWLSLNIQAFMIYPSFVFFCACSLSFPNNNT